MVGAKTQITRGKVGAWLGTGHGWGKVEARLGHGWGKNARGNLAIR